MLTEGLKESITRVVSWVIEEDGWHALSYTSCQHRIRFCEIAQRAFFVDDGINWIDEVMRVVERRVGEGCDISRL